MGTGFSRGLMLLVKPPAKPLLLAGGYSPRMDIHAIRLQNLRTLISERTSRGATKKSVAVWLNLSPSFLSQLEHGKTMGSDVARKIEQAAGLSFGWLDTGRSRIAEDLAHYASQSARLDPVTLASAFKLVRLSCEALEVTFDPEKPGDSVLVLLACDYMDEQSTETVTPDNVVDFTKLLRKKLRESNEEPTKHAGAPGASAR